MTSLKSFIKAVRAAKTVADERTAIQKESAAIRTSFREGRASNSTRRTNVAKLLYLFTLGERTHFGQVECVKLLASPYFVDKRLGYLGTMLLLDENQEVLMLITNSLDNDLTHPNQYVVSLALTTLANIASVQMARDLVSKVQKILSSSNPYLRKKAALSALRIIRKEPELEYMILDHLKVLLTDQNHGVLLCGCSLAIDMIDNNPELVDQLDGLLVHLLRALKQLSTTGYNPEFDVGGIPDPFLQTRLIRLLRAIGQDNPDLSEHMGDLLAAIVTNTDSSKNVGNSVLYEAVLAIFGIESDSALRVLGINVLGKFLANRDNNTRYVALNTLLKVVSIEPVAVQRHRATIVNCFQDPDISIRRRALELSYSLINEQNVRVMIRELLTFLEHCDVEFKTELVSQIALAAERFAPNKRWHVDTLLRILNIAGGYAKENILSAFILLVIETPDLQTYVVQRLYIGLHKDFSQQGLTIVSLWLIGEYADQILGTSFSVDEEQVQVTDESLVDLVLDVLKSPYASRIVQEYGINALIKLTSRLSSSAQIDKIRRYLSNKEHSLDSEIQQRAIEYSVLFGESSIRKGVLAKMPAPEFGDDLETQHAKAMSKALVRRKKRVPISTGQNAHKRDRNRAVADLLDLGGDTSTEAPSNDLIADIFASTGNSAAPAAAKSAETKSSSADILGLFGSTAPATTPAPATPAADLVSAFSNEDLELKFSGTKEGPGSAQIRAVFTCKTPIRELALQVAVPKSQTLSLQPLSTASIDPGQEATQAIKISGPANATVRLRLRVSYSSRGQQHREQFDFANFKKIL